MEEQAVSPVSKRVSFAPSVSLRCGYAMPCAKEGCRNDNCGCLVQAGVLGHAGHIVKVNEKVEMFDASAVANKTKKDIEESSDNLDPGEVTLRVKEAVRRAHLAHRIAHTKARKARGLSTSSITSCRGHSGAK